MIHTPSLEQEISVHPRVRGDDKSGAATTDFHPVHPRVRGDDRRSRNFIALHAGSPPRAWGRCTVSLITDNKVRFTPACVGTMRPVSVTTACRTVHPRVRGDDFPNCSARSYRPGSPPRAWGRSRLSLCHCPHLRFTPACVGTITLHYIAQGDNSVHPRVRGDDTPTSFTNATGNGSPPRAWGRSGQQRPSPSPSRFTPACVGTIAIGRSRWTRRPVHPRVRGDDTDILAAIWGSAQAKGPRSLRSASSCPPSIGS